MPVVQITRNGSELTVSDLQIEVQLGDSVEWKFLGLNLQELAYIRFDHLDYPETRPYGPFQCLEPSSFDVRGLGNTGLPGEYRYTAFVLNDQGVVATSNGQAKVVNLATQVDTSPEATIHFNGTQLHVEPPTLKVDIGRPALWYITGVPAGHFITFRFDGFDDAMVGPFSSFQISRGLGAAQVAAGSNFTGPVGGQSQVQYHVSLHRPDGSVLVSDDPVIEPPPGWPPHEG